MTLPLPLPGAAPHEEALLVRVRIAGEPVRAKHACTCIGRGIAARPSTRPDPTWSRWREEAVPLLVAWWGGRPPIVVPVRAHVVAVFRRPQSPRRTFVLRGVERPYPYPWDDGRVPFVGRPDWDQVGKASVDVLVHARILEDDPLVVAASLDRWYAAEGEEPSVEVTLTSCNPGRNS